MKKSKRNFVSIIIVTMVCVLLALLSCSSDPTPAKTDLITRPGGWAFTSKILNDVETIATCDKDDLIQFAKDKTLTITYGTNLCTSNDVTQTGSWEIYGANESLLHLGLSSGNLEYTIVELTSSTLKISYQDTITGQSATFTFVGH